MFTFAVFESFVYLVSKGALEWGPVKRVLRQDEMVDSSRTAETTVRRVGLEGREDRWR